MENVHPAPAGPEQQQEVESTPINSSTTPATAAPTETPQKQDEQKAAVQDDEDSDFDELDGMSLRYDI